MAVTLDNDTRAAWSFYRTIRDWSLRLKPWHPALWHETKPDEKWDLTLVSQRVYGRRDEFLVVMATAGLDNVDDPLRSGRRLAFPSEQALYAFKRQCQFESRAEYREDGEPIWL